MAPNTNDHGNASSQLTAGGNRPEEMPKSESTPLTTLRFSQGSHGDITQNKYNSGNDTSSTSALPAANEQDIILRGSSDLPATSVGALLEKGWDTPGAGHQPSSPEPSQAGHASETERRTQAGEATSGMGTETGTLAGIPGQAETKLCRSPSKPTCLRRLIMKIRRWFSRRRPGP
ncbi:hypothetical protein H4582DRAFT_2054099 [Lactarius indigo]|nr:hypothetical protein H4582DRAFT_2054099 [Lactarius indigo]